MLVCYPIKTDKYINTILSKLPQFSSHNQRKNIAPKRFSVN